jgi:hypothetical protein
MRGGGTTTAALALLLAGSAFAQAEWTEFVNRDDHFTVNFPGDPKVDAFTYKTEKGTALPAHIYTAQDSRGVYRITVVDYRMAPDEVATAIAEAAKTARTKGEVKYDNSENLDQIKDQRISLLEPSGQHLVLYEILSEGGRLYISEASVGVKAAPPAQFQASLQILDDEGVRIRYRSVGSTERAR